MGSAKRDLYAKPTASHEVAQLWDNANHQYKTSFPKGGLRHPTGLDG